MMAPDLTAAPAGPRRRGVARKDREGEPPLSQLKGSTLKPSQQAKGKALRFVPMPADARRRLGRMKLNAVKGELRRAELAFVTARRFLGDAHAQEAAGRVADALGRVNRAVDSVEKGAAIHPAAEVLVGVSTFDPEVRPADFIQRAGRSVALAGKVIAESEFDCLRYWGRKLSKLAGTFTAVKADTAT